MDEGTKGSESWECSSNSPRYGEGWDIPPRPLFSNEGLIPKLLGVLAVDCPRLSILSRIAQSGTELSFSGLGPFLPRGSLHSDRDRSISVWPLLIQLRTT